MAYQADQIQQAVAATIRDEMGGLRTFVDRRIAELSAEIHATVQRVEFGKTNLAGLRKPLAEVIAAPTTATRTSGQELEAVLQATAAAANRIIAAAEAIGDWLRRSGRNDPAGLDAVNEKVNASSEAGSFQDVTGQRIERAIQHLRQAEMLLTDIAPNQPHTTSEARLLPHASPNGAKMANTEPPIAHPALHQDAVA